METEDALKLDKQLCFPLYGVSRLLTRIYQPYLAEKELTYPQYLILLALWENGPQQVGALGACLLLDTNTLTPLIKRMEEKNLVKKSKPKDDKRGILVSLTPKARALKKELKHLPQTLLSRLSATGIQSKELISLKLTLDSLLIGLQQELKNEDKSL